MAALVNPPAASQFRSTIRRDCLAPRDLPQPLSGARSERIYCFWPWVVDEFVRRRRDMGRYTMKFHQFACWVVIALSSIAPISAAEETSQATGKVIVEFSTAETMRGWENFSLQFRTRDRAHRDWTSYSHGGLILNTGDDFEDQSEKGAVKILTLPAGEWEIWSATIANSMISFSPKNDFSVPFVVKPGETIYIGGYRGVWTYGRTIIGTSTEAGAYFAVSDQSLRDVAIAKMKDRTITDVDIAIPDFAVLRIPFFHVALPKELSAVQGFSNQTSSENSN